LSYKDALKLSPDHSKAEDGRQRLVEIMEMEDHKAVERIAKMQDA
jgi:hypothetical protein